MRLANEGVDAVRRAEAKDRPELKPRRYIWRKNRSNLSFRQRDRLAELQGLNLDNAEVFRKRLTLKDFYVQPN